MTTNETTTDFESEDTKKPPAKEVPVVQDQGFFQHDTGDMYDGFFEAKKKDRFVKMHGPGVYTTVEGDRYTGQWEADKFGVNDDVVITFSDGAKFEGLIKDWCYSGHGTYTYPDGGVLQCEFSENCPTGSMKLIDPNGHAWLGKAEQGYGWLEPVNHYYEFLETTRDPRSKKRRNKNPEAESTISTSPMKLEK